MHPGVVRIELLTEELEEKIRGIEHSPYNIGFTPVDPVGFGEICGFDLKLILFCSSEFPMFTERFMDIIDSRGTLIGHDVMDSDKHLFSARRLVWLTDNLFVDTAMMSDYPLKTVIRSLQMDIEGVEDADVRVYYPCADAADYLNEMFGATGKITATVLIGANNVKF